MKRKTNAALLLVLAFALIAGACSGGTSGEYDLVTEDTLTVCSDIPYAPFEFEEGGSYSGFDVELMEAIGAELDLEVVFIDSGSHGSPEHAGQVMLVSEAGGPNCGAPKVEVGQPRL